MQAPTGSTSRSMLSTATFVRGPTDRDGGFASRATATGLVRSNTTTKTDIPNSVENVNGRKRKGTKIRSGNEVSSISASDQFSSFESTTTLQEVNDEVSNNESLNHRQEPQFIGIHMSLQQEEVFGSMGFNPTLLLDTSPVNENIIVRIIRPGEDADEILEAGRKQIASNAGRRRRRGRNGNRNLSRNGNEVTSIVTEGISKSPSNDSQKESNDSEINTFDENSLSKKVDLEDSSFKVEGKAEEGEEADAAQEVVVEAEDPRRRRRRSSASNSNG